MNQIVTNTSENSSYPKSLAGYVYIHTEPVAWGEMDAFGHVNNVAYYRYAESARIGYLYALGMSKDNTLTILVGSSCNYLSAVTYPDTLLVGVKCECIGNTSLTMFYVFYSTAQDKIVATANSTIVRVNQHHQKQAWSDREKQQIESFEQAKA